MEIFYVFHRQYDSYYIMPVIFYYFCCNIIVDHIPFSLQFVLYLITMIIISIWENTSYVITLPLTVLKILSE